MTFLLSIKVTPSKMSCCLVISRLLWKNCWWSIEIWILKSVYVRVLFISATRKWNLMTFSICIQDFISIMLIALSSHNFILFGLFLPSKLKFYVFHYLSGQKLKLKNFKIKISITSNLVKLCLIKSANSRKSNTMYRKFKWKYWGSSVLKQIIYIYQYGSNCIKKTVNYTQTRNLSTRPSTE